MAVTIRRSRDHGPDAHCNRLQKRLAALEKRQTWQNTQMVECSCRVVLSSVYGDYSLVGGLSRTMKERVLSLFEQADQLLDKILPQLKAGKGKNYVLGYRENIKWRLEVLRVLFTQGLDAVAARIEQEGTRLRTRAS